ncbi:hypothetical protein TPAR_03457 [Tolypocladium paradoxum]|uniref:Protein kinase domain-containing protein n=1 Tax=Tolypocladium paradoxum TaxID=94208 RepID=A0A2S4L1M0_9HYPO|nr:hypothetical protein TPAR_03457 [Tolypocladium paradoxum]
MDDRPLSSSSGSSMSAYGDLDEPALLSVKFRLGYSTVSAIGDWNDSEHPNVLRLSILRNSFDHAIISFLPRLPLAIQTLVRSIFPGYFLPSRIILKKLKPNWDDEFNNEKRMYERLQVLQGHLIPRCYGEARCDNTRALVLSEIDGVEPFNQKSPYLQPDEFQRQLETAFGELGAFGLVYGDLKLDNFLIVEDRIVILDLESVSEEKLDEIEYITWTHVAHLKRMYEGHVRGLSCDW